MKYHYLGISLWGIFLIGCSNLPKATNTVDYYQKTELHSHVFKFTDCEDKIKHKHGGTKGKNIVLKTHKHHWLDGKP